MAMGAIRFQLFARDTLCEEFAHDAFLLNIIAFRVLKKNVLYRIIDADTEVLFDYVQTPMRMKLNV